MKTINNNIQEDYCSFEVSKLLKEKGCEIENTEGLLFFSEKREDVILQDTGSLADSYSEISYNSNKDILKLTHALAIKWILKNFGIHISVNYIDDVILYGYDICEIKINTQTDVYKFTSPKEAAEAALLYTLTNLIK